MIKRILERGALTVSLLLFLAAFAVLAGCGSNTAGETTTTANNASTTTSAAVQLTKWDKELAKTASTQAGLTQILVEQKAAKDDPRRGIIYGLRARTLAIACRQALERNDLQLADSGMLEVHYALNESRNLATGTAAQTMADARAIVDNLGAPSAQPAEAAKLLDEFIAALAPMVDEANAIISTTTTS